MCAVSTVASLGLDKASCKTAMILLITCHSPLVLFTVLEQEEDLLHCKVNTLSEAQ